MTLDQEEKQRLAQLGLDRRLAEAVAALDEEAAIFLRLAGDESAEEAEIMQAASNYRAAVQRRNIAYDKACGVAEDQAGAPTSTLGVDPEELKRMVEEATAGAAPPKIDGDALRAAVDEAIKAQLPGLVKAEVDKASQGTASETRKPSGTQAKSS